MTFTDGTKTVEITLTDANGIDWTADFFQVGDLEMTEDGAYIVEDTALLIEAIEDYKAGRGDYEGMECNSDIEVEEVAPKFDEYSFESYDELKAWLDARKDDKRAVYYYGFMENFDGTLYTVADIASDMDASWFDEGQTVEIYEEAKA